MYTSRPSRSDSKYSAPFCGRSQRTAPMFSPFAASPLLAVLFAMRSLPSLVVLQALVRSGDELLRRPPARRRAVAAVIVGRRLRSLHLSQRHSHLDHAADAVAND